MHQAIMKFKLAQVGKSSGSGLCVPAGAILGIGPHKKAGKAVVRMRSGKHHSSAQRSSPGMEVELVALGDWRKIHARWQAIQSAG